jgi:hypothetical protein
LLRMWSCAGHLPSGPRGVHTAGGDARRLAGQFVEPVHNLIPG